MLADNLLIDKIICAKYINKCKTAYVTLCEDMNDNNRSFCSFLKKILILFAAKVTSFASCGKTSAELWELIMTFIDNTFFFTIEVKAKKCEKDIKVCRNQSKWF